MSDQLYSQIIQAVFMFIGGLLAFIFNKVSKDIHELTHEVGELNLKIAVMILRLEQHEKRIIRLEGKPDGID